MPQKILYKIPPDLKGMVAVLENVKPFFQNVYPERAFFLLLGIEEFLANIIRYGQCNAPETLDITLEIWVQENTLSIDITDTGSAFNPLAFPPPALEKSLEQRPLGGLGIHLAKAQFTELSYKRTPKHNCFRALKTLPAHPAP